MTVNLVSIVSCNLFYFQFQRHDNGWQEGRKKREEGSVESTEKWKLARTKLNEIRRENIRKEVSEFYSLFILWQYPSKLKSSSENVTSKKFPQEIKHYNESMSVLWWGLLRMWKFCTFCDFERIFDLVSLKQTRDAQCRYFYPSKDFDPRESL